MEKEVGGGVVDSPALKYPKEDLVAALSVALLLSLAGKHKIERITLLADSSAAGYAHSL